MRLDTRTPTAVCLVGGTGFIGRHLARRLDAAGSRVTVLSRKRERDRSLLVLPRVTVAAGDVYQREFLASQFAGHDAVINLVGILNEKGRDGSGFEHAHVELSRAVVAACGEAGVPRLLHMSALNASPDGPSHYLRTKGVAENEVHAAERTGEFAVTSFRPSVVFGPDDSFINRFAALLRNTPGVFPLACPGARFQPVYVGDVVAAFLYALREPAAAGQRFDLCGPNQYTLREIVEYVAGLLGVRRRIIPLSDRIARTQAQIMEWVPGKPFSLDNYWSLQLDSVCPGACTPVPDLRPVAMEEVVPSWLCGGGQRDRYDEFRRHARR